MTKERRQSLESQLDSDEVSTGDLRVGLQRYRSFFERLLETYLSYAPTGFRSFLKAMPLWLRQKLHLPREMSRGLGGQYKKRYVFTEHHESHAASAFYPFPFPTMLGVMPNALACAVFAAAS